MTASTPSAPPEASPAPGDSTGAGPDAAPAQPASPLLDLPGAVPAEGVDAGTAWHYGDPVREQRLLQQGLALVDLSTRGVVRVAGPDRLSWLHSLTTQALADLAPRTSAEALLLSPKGHVEQAMHVVDDGEATWITVEPGAQAALVTFLDRMRFMLRVEVEDVTDRVAVVGEPVRRESAPGEPLAWVDPWPATAPSGVAYAAVPDAEHPGASRAWREVLVPREELVGFTADRDLAGTWAAEALRVEAWRPRAGAETDHRTIPHELDWLRTAVHLRKGCYRGQETVARVHNLGRPPRRLVALHLDGYGHDLPPAGSVVSLTGEDGAPGRAVGAVTTAARHHELGPVALAVVKRSTPADAVLLAALPAGGAVTAAQELVVAP
ncbi:folate-binding protein YgfZ [uncultured Pseudokineococcus sp.]|uniref:CAF17-like 4Fe-4S cluster assembly/insertion protein YgfZ n=1 Tax=uncultured Pseudokineococcus sp. TaxID=1642928 RepID=UPI00260FAD54|nr:folate-binding protein [uncultured Pseudokineococcus sp.]